MLVAYPLPDKGYRYSIRRGIGLFIMRMGVWRCPLEDRQEHHSTLEPELNLADIDYQYVTSDDLMH